MEIGLVDENPITLQNAYPITDTEASLLTPYTFTITNKCNTIVEYDVNLDIMESSNRLNSSYIATQFNGGEKRLLNTLESVDVSYPKNDYIPVEGRYLTSGELGANESISYGIKLWMDESVTVQDDAMNKSFISKVVVTGKQSHKVRLVDYIMNDNEIEEFTHAETYQTKALTDYRYTGANPNNYVCFGSEETPCPEDNLYRIIGVIPTQSEIGKDKVYENRVKLIRATEYTENESSLLKDSKGYTWNDNRHNKLENSPLNVKVLNEVYWGSLKEYQKYIESSVWYLGAPNYQKQETYTSENFYNLERSNTKGKSGGALNFIGNIGLMYPSDYAYSIGKDYQNKIVNSNTSSYITTSWLTVNELENFLATEEIGDIPSTWYRWVSGRVAGSNNNVAIIRPTFYLKANVLYGRGIGTQEEPYRINIHE